MLSESLCGKFSSYKHGKSVLKKIKKKKYIYKERLFYKDCFIKIVYTNHRKIVKNLDEFFILYINITI